MFGPPLLSAQVDRHDARFVGRAGQGVAERHGVIARAGVGPLDRVSSVGAIKPFRPKGNDLHGYIFDTVARGLVIRTKRRLARDQVAVTVPDLHAYPLAQVVVGVEQAFARVEGDLLLGGYGGGRCLVMLRPDGGKGVLVAHLGDAHAFVEPFVGQGDGCAEHRGGEPLEQVFQAAVFDPVGGAQVRPHADHRAVLPQTGHLKPVERLGFVDVHKSDPAALVLFGGFERLDLVVEGIESAHPEVRGIKQLWLRYAVAFLGGRRGAAGPRIGRTKIRRRHARAPVPVFFGGACSLPSQGLLGVMLFGLMPPTVIGLAFMFWAERGKKPTKRLFGFSVGLVLFPLCVLLPIAFVLSYFKVN